MNFRVKLLTNDNGKELANQIIKILRNCNDNKKLKEILIESLKLLGKIEQLKLDIRPTNIQRDDALSIELERVKSMSIGPNGLQQFIKDGNKIQKGQSGL